MNLGDSLNVSVSRNPQKTAMILGHERLSYEQLKHSSESVALWLLDRGCKPGDRIALHRPNSIEMVKLLFVCFKAGMFAVPVNVRLKAPEVAYIIGHSKAAICFAHPHLVSVTEQAYQNSATRPRLLSSLPDRGLDDSSESPRGMGTSTAGSIESTQEGLEFVAQSKHCKRIYNQRQEFCAAVQARIQPAATRSRLNWALVWELRFATGNRVQKFGKRFLEPY